MNPPELVFDAATIAADGRTLLGPVSLRIDRPGITVVMGPNGAGKSLFLSAAHGLLVPDQGSITWNGQPASKTRASRGFVFQATPVLRRSVRGNIALPLIARGVSRAKAADRIAAALAEARLDTDPAKPAAALSGGERKRLDLARAIVTRPNVVLLDEPSANLDPATTAELEQSLRHIAEGGTKILISTHDIAQARRLAAEILFFSEGRLLEQADTASFFRQPASNAAQRFLDGER